MAERSAASRPDSPPWGAAITAGCARAGLSARAAARQAGISEARWRQIAGGYQVVRAGVYAPVRGPAPTVARMAEVAGLTAAQLRAAGRDDAARLLAAREGAGAGELLLARIRSMDTGQARELLAQVAAALFDSVAGEAGAGLGGAHDADGADEPRYGT